jgi:hypothetical protein
MAALIAILLVAAPAPQSGNVQPVPFSEKTAEALKKVIEQRSQDWRDTRRLDGVWQSHVGDRYFIERFDYAKDRSHSVRGYYKGDLVMGGEGWYQFENGELVIYQWKNRKVADRSSARVFEVKKFTDDALHLVYKKTGERVDLYRVKP